MKTIVITLAVLFFSINNQAQNKTVLNTTKTTTTTVDDGTEVKKFVEKENVVKTQNTDVDNAPVLLTTTTQITNPDGTTRTTSVNRSGYYLLDNVKYKVDLDSQGYTLSTDKSTNPHLLRKTSTNSYIYINENKMAVSYFDTEGNLIIEIYNDKTDSVEHIKYNLVKE